MDLRPIYINGRFLARGITGTQRYAHELLDGLDAELCRSPGNRGDITILTPPTRQPMPEYKALKIRAVGTTQSRFWEQFELPYYARNGLLLTLCGGAPILHSRNIITIHDAAVSLIPKNYSILFRTWYRWLYHALCHRSLHVFTVSQASKADMVACWAAPPHKISVSYLGAEHVQRPMPKSDILARYGLKPFEYVFTVSSRSRNKNRYGLLRAFAMLDSKYKLVIAGGGNTSVFNKLPTQPPLAPNVLDVGYVSDAELRELNENALSFVFPSLREGFGLPPLEAMAAGCPAVVSNTSSLAEVFGSLAFLCDPKDPADIAAKIVEASAATAEYRERCRRFASLFKWERCAKMTWAKVSELRLAESEDLVPAGGVRWQPLRQR